MAFAEEKPLGLSQLIPLQMVLIRQKTTFMAPNKYVVMTPGEDVILYAKEERNGLGQILSGPGRSFKIDVLDTQHREVFRLRRPFTIGNDKMEIYVCGRLVCLVRKHMTLFKPVLYINDPHDSPVMRVKGPVVTGGECDFELQTLPDKRRIGAISKKWAGGMRELFTNSDNYQITFPQDLDVNYKASVIGVCFLIDFLYYEK